MVPDDGRLGAPARRWPPHRGRPNPRPAGDPRLAPAAASCYQAPVLLIVNADDLGYDPEIDRGILEAHSGGLVTSATAMVDTAFAARALADAPRSLGVGLHVVLAPGLSPGDVGVEVRRQVERFRALRGAPPTHLDSHKHAHVRPDALPAFAAEARALGLPVRSIDEATRRALRAAGLRTSDHFLGDAALRPCWTRERLLAALASLTGAAGVAELMAHPGRTPSHARTSFGAEREVEREALCDPEARAAAGRAGLRLGTWLDAAGR
ncbi:MAG: ChbG/HpnK family deacetylase [Deltaproteobacteria bacterium]|nr:ChbG/HpnK family deacetylase [Deltaproteobacteria bacterium]